MPRAARLLPAATLAAGLVAGLAGGPAPAWADDVFEVCKGESRTVVTGKGRMSIAVVYPDGFPVETTPAMRNAVGAQLARQEKAKIVPAKDVLAARKLVEGRRWAERSDACDLAPSLVAVLGQRHPNLSTATASVACEGERACELRIDLERHGRPSADRWVRYVAPLAGPKDQVATIQAAARKLTPRGAPPDAPTRGLARQQLPLGVVTVRSDVDGALEADRAMEASAAFAACRPKGRKAHDLRGYWAEWQLSARGTPFRAMVKPFAGRDPSDAKAAACLRKALEQTQLACPRDGKPIQVRTAICM